METMTIETPPVEELQPYQINLDIFEGPLDLLLHLIKKNDLEIAEIPIAFIMEKYLDYINMMKELDIDLAGEFILMAAELAHIKSKMLVAKDEDPEEEEVDPRADLIARLLEYQKFKNAASWLNKQPILFRDVFKRTQIEKPEELNHQEEGPLEVEPFQLLNVFNKILEKAPKQALHEVESERISVTDRIYQIVDLLKTEDSLLFEALFEDNVTRSRIVLTFLAILEMAKLKMIKVFQMDPQGPIRVKKVMELNDPEHHDMEGEVSSTKENQ